MIIKLIEGVFSRSLEPLSKHEAYISQRTNTTKYSTCFKDPNIILMMLAQVRGWQGPHPGEKLHVDSTPDLSDP